ncbi:MAG: rod shape-determining protein MreC [Patescibacteria group bacterium]|nr:rod shape-determining protein MreC [Patescibacteria group bacterium]
MDRYYRAPKRGRRRLMAATALVILILIADVVSGGYVRGQVRLVASVVSGWGSALMRGVASTGFLQSSASLKAENRALKIQVAQLSERAASAEALKRENDALRELARLAADTPGITAPIISSVSASPYGTFLIGTGGSDIISGDMVMTEGGFVVGIVSDVRESTALVSEIFAPGNSIDASLQGAYIRVEGRGGGNAHAEAPRDLIVGVGDVVVAPSFGQRPIGIVGAVASTSASASQDVYLHLPSALSAISFVYVSPSDY